MIIHQSVEDYNCEVILEKSKSHIPQSLTSNCWPNKTLFDIHTFRLAGYGYLHSMQNCQLHEVIDFFILTATSTFVKLCCLHVRSNSVPQ